jgi:type 1 glutamine amidotransferase
MTRLSFHPALNSMFAILFVAALALQKSTARGAEPDRPIRALLVLGGCCHDYAHQKDIISKGISLRANVEWTIAYDPDTTTKHLNPIYKNDDWAQGYDVVVHDECTADVTDPKIIDRILKPHREGLPAIVLHCGMHCYRTPGWDKRGQGTPWMEFTGLQTTAHGSQLPIAITFADRESPITKNMTDWTTIKEELYNNFNGKLYDTAHALARGTQTYKRAGKDVTDDYVVAWTNLYNGKARVFATTLGHNNETVADSRYLDLLTRGLLWSLDKLDDAHLKPAK